MGILAIRSPLKIHCYTYMSFKTCLSRLIYTKLSSHRSFVINTYVITMAWRCISPWSFHRSPQRRREMDIVRYISRFPHIPSKNDQKKKRKPVHESILTPVILHKHVRYHDGVTLYFSMKFPSVAPKKTRNGYDSRFPLSEVKTTKNKKEIKKEENFDWTTLNTENLRAEIATCQRQYYM